MTTSKRDKKKLRDLACVAYERDLSRCLNVVHEHFEQWKAGDISVWDLEQHIHEFHNQIGRELYKCYTMSDPFLSVAFGVKQGVISLDDVPSPMKEQIERFSEAIGKNDITNV